MTTRLSPEQAAAQRKERLEGMHAQLSEKVETLNTSEGWKHAMTMAARLRHHSFRNQLLIAAQRPDATAVAGYRQWQQMGRQVTKGAEAIWILGPIKYKTEIEDQQTGEKTTGFSLRGFKPLSVFALQDTTGPELPKPAHLTGEAPRELWDGLTRLLADQGYTVERVELPGGRQGSTSPTEHRVRIDSRLQPMEALAVLFHEHAHVALGHMSQVEDYARHRGPFEVEAESAVFIEMTALGFDTGSWSVEYVAGWQQTSPDALAKTAERAVSVAHDTIERLSPDPAALEPNGIGVAL